ncbi:NAD(P)H-dependent glycerol-3-phosphate dehydrogenase [Aliidiomarina minuta]|uniref:Glycerol-3-phosphate dehydrogenase [NAD(P)+] n=1 Tax=Aliidiomarina minuta TaxID=880057 RepID=A0A432W9U4_9GAMM|nr:NAD(P)H-dependent glycerol-3-phosphate dehydrogenase [Aliidiomarina minuta]RUO26805.1 NAD(P)H-dependent glycerol-3-phosphate dehydrogenase [Aliidiomarina minuta]
MNTTVANSAITVLGAGSYGTALAICIARKGVALTLWGRNSDDMQNMQNERENSRYLPGCPLPDGITLEADLAKAVEGSDTILIVVPSYGFAEVLEQIKPYLRPTARVAWATKGLEPGTGRLLSDVAVDILGPERPLAVLSGPTFAAEMAKGMPTAIAVASTQPGFVSELSEMLHCDRSFRVYLNDDFIGIQLGGAVKNVIAIGAGMADGIGFGANTRTALITRGLAELTRLGIAVGGKPETFTGMAGLGDLILTCTDNQSRNRRFGMGLGKGRSVDEAMADIGQAVEGYRNTKEVFELAKRYDVEMPIVEQIYYVLYEGKEPMQASQDLLSRAQTTESL